MQSLQDSVALVRRDKPPLPPLPDTLRPIAVDTEHTFATV